METEEHISNSLSTIEQNMGREVHPLPTTYVSDTGTTAFYWGSMVDEIRPRLNAIEECMFKYAASMGRTIHNSSTVNHNCLLESVLVAIEDAGSAAYFYPCDPTIQLFQRDYPTIRRQIAKHIRRYANTSFHNDGEMETGRGVLSYKEDYDSDPENQRLPWEQYLNLIEHNAFLDLRCIMALCRELGNITINVLQFFDATNRPVSFVCGNNDLQVHPHKHSVTVALRENQHFYAIINPANWLEGYTRDLTLPNCPHIRIPMQQYTTVSTEHQISNRHVPNQTSATNMNTNASETLEFNCAFLNVRTLKDTSEYKRQSSKISRLHEYSHLAKLSHIDIIGMAETRIQGPDNTWNGKTGYSFFFSGSTTKGCKIGGVGIGIKDKWIKGGALEYILPINERLMAIWGIFMGRKLSIIVAYAPTSCSISSQIDTEQFYKDLDNLITKIPETYRTYCIVLGDFNARIGGLKDCDDDSQMLEKHGIREACDQVLGPFITDDPNKTPYNDNGIRLVHFCNKHNFRVGNSLFQSTASTGSATWGTAQRQSTNQTQQHVHEHGHGLLTTKYSRIKERQQYQIYFFCHH